MDHTLLVLGLLKLQRMHGYQLSELIERRLSYLTDLKKPTLYHLLQKLEAEGDVVKTVSREGNRPERHTYRLTPAGARRFAELLRRNLQDAHAAFFNDDIGLIFLSELPAAEARVYLESKRRAVADRIVALEAGLARHKVGTPPYYTLRHHLLHLQTERGWLDEFLGQVKARAVRGDILECLAETGDRSPGRAASRTR